MCDSITILVLLEDQSQEDYDQCQYPTRGKEDADETSSDFRAQYPLSPLTGAGFVVTAVGQKLSTSCEVGPGEKNRKNYGRLAGYLVNLNPPTCTVGHNRLLVNGVPAAARMGLALLKHWMACHGCTQAGLDAARIDNVIIISATPTFLFTFADEAAARLVLATFRVRSEALCNTKTKGRQVKQPAFSIPPKQQPHEMIYIYTSYIKLREYFIDCYVKVSGVAGMFVARFLDKFPEFLLENSAKRTLRIGVKLHGKWLKDNGLDKVQNWRGNEEGYKQAFGLIREELQLDKDFRAKQLRTSTVEKLSLSQSDKTLLRYHLARNKVREHPMFLKMTTKQASKAYSASQLRVFAATGISFEVHYAEHLKVFSPPLGQQLIYPGEYSPPKDIAPFVFSRISVESALFKLAELTDQALKQCTNVLDEAGTGSQPPIPQQNASFPQVGRRPRHPRYARGISEVPVDPHAD